MSDVNQAKNAISNNLAIMIRHFVIIIANICILFSINTTLTILVLLTVPIYLCITVNHTKKSKVLIR